MYYPDSREPCCMNFSPCSSLSNTGTNLTLHLWDFTGGEYRFSRSSKLPVIWSFWKIIRFYHECEGRIEKSAPRLTVWHHKACQVMTNSDHEGWIFLSYPHTNNGIFFLLNIVFFYFKISFQKSRNTLRSNFTWWCHFNITMMSLDDHVREFQYNQCM